MRNLFLVTIFSLVSIISSNAKSAEEATLLESAPQMIAVDVKLIEISRTKLCAFRQTHLFVEPLRRQAAGFLNMETSDGEASARSGEGSVLA